MKNIFLNLIFCLSILNLFACVKQEIAMPALNTNTVERPTSLKTEVVGPTSIKLNWQNPAHPDFSHIQLYRTDHQYLSSPDAQYQIYSGTGSTYTDINLNAGTRYYYTLFAIYKNNESSYRIQANAIPYSVCMVRNLTMQSLVNSLAIILSKPLDTQFQGIRIQRNSEATAHYPQNPQEGKTIYEDTFGGDTTSILDNIDFTCGENYYYTIFSYNTNHQYALEGVQVRGSGFCPGQVKPQVSILSPGDNIYINSSLTVLIQAQSIAGYPITKVELYVDGVLYSTPLTLPNQGENYQFVFNPASYTEGAHTIKVKAYNTLSAGDPSIFTEKQILVTKDTQLPEININYPDLTLPQKGLVKIKADITDNYGIKVSALKWNNQLITQDWSAPYEYVWDTFGKNLEGSHTLKISALDWAGNLREKAFSLIINNPPEIIRSEPYHNQIALPLTLDLFIFFSETMQTATLNTDTIKLTANGNPVNFTIQTKIDAFTGQFKAVLSPEILLPNQIYTLWLSKNITDLSGNGLFNDSSVFFTTGNSVSIYDDERCQFDVSVFAP
jgi:hypothetical protein